MTNTPEPVKPSFGTSYFFSMFDSDKIKTSTFVVVNILKQEGIT
jgi:hypothetical protein